MTGHLPRVGRRHKGKPKGPKNDLKCDVPFKLATRAALAILLLWPQAAFAHGVARGDARFLQSLQGVAIGPLMYLGAKHMVTGYDHLLFLVGVIFFLYRMKDVLLYVSLFTVGHSVTLLAGVLGGIHANAFIVDAIIGLSIVYKAFENMGGFRQLLGWQPDTRAAVLIFGLCHGFGLATKLQEFTLPAVRAGHQHRQLQRRRGNRPAARAHRRPDRVDVLAHTARVPAPCVRDQRRADGRRLPARRISDDRLSAGGAMTEAGRSRRIRPASAKARRPRRSPAKAMVGGSRSRPLAR